MGDCTSSCVISVNPYCATMFAWFAYLDLQAPSGEVILIRAAWTLWPTCPQQQPLQFWRGMRPAAHTVITLFLAVRVMPAVQKPLQCWSGVRWLFCRAVLCSLCSRHVADSLLLTVVKGANTRLRVSGIAQTALQSPCCQKPCTTLLLHSARLSMHGVFRPQLPAT